MTTKLYVGNLPRVLEEHQLQALFSANGRQVRSIQIVLDPQTKRCKGFAFVEMENSEDARLAIEALHGKGFLGRPLSVSLAREKPKESPEAERRRGKTRVWNRTFHDED